MDRERLSNALGVIFDKLVAEGMIRNTDDDEKEKIITHGLDNLEKTGLLEDLHQDQIRNDHPAVQKALAVALIAEFVQGRNPQFKFDYTVLFKQVTENSEDELKNDLKPQLVSLFQELNKLNPNPEKQISDKEMDELADFLVTQLAIAQDPKQSLVADNDSLIDTLATLLAECLNNTPDKQYTR